MHNHLAKLIPAAAILSAAVMLSSCSHQTQITSWRDANFSGPAFHKIFVLVFSDNLPARQNLEHAIVSKLHDEGVAGVEGLTLVPPDHKLDQIGLGHEFDSLGIDGFLLVRSTGKSDLERTVTNSTYYDTYSGYYDRYNGMSGIGASQSTENTEIYGAVINSESSLYSTASQALIWRGNGVTTHYNDMGGTAKDFASVIVDDMKRNYLFDVKK